MKEKVFYVINETEIERQGGREETRRETVLEFMNLDITKTNIKYIRDSVPDIKQGEKRKRCNPKSDYRTLTSDAFLNQKPNKQTSHK